MNFLAIDWGEKRIGLAVGAIFPKGAGVIDGAKDSSQIIDEIKSVIAENEVDKIVVGMPMLPSGDEGRLAPQIKKFAIGLGDATGLPIIFEPEEFTSVEAKDQFKAHGKIPNRKSGKTDEMAAIMILEKFLEKMTKS
ncbi:Holliday junction resolvase RuvX [Candidatus Berkelbacteria bacterium CG10_big_fil_rev_8_21_14_0_10_43_13]|uniref:Putative pre-16S rRNA nuclease n=1 Tax=Candidatus Berkelbacteria bacterium CG10_big_fil_rev_8_21_14_0_10_43_13 TaxID=1974514 RepID=A0A2H0W6U2_9BACT|nr:MAG: Holliday junction resolvase RuvX [Candidatus Berkelbacteria bacterium CG10_big_fil_rev_8_21_14_0_10_43_13]